MRETELCRALARSVTGCQPAESWKHQMVRQIVKGQDLQKRTKLSFGVVAALALILLSAIALAVGVLVHEYYARVAEMERSGALTRWNLEDKISFVQTMRDCNFDMDPELYRILSDSALPDEKREAAADRIIDNTYGELIRNQLGYYIVEPEDSLGIAPDPVVIFEERYAADHPEGIRTHEELVAYTDALGYYLRDEVYGKLFELELEERGEQAEPTVIDEAYAVQALKNDMTEVYGWDPEAVEAMVPEVSWNETYRMWTVSGEVSRESMEKVTDPRKGWEPVLSGATIEKTEIRYRASVLVDEQGRSWAENLDKDAFRQAYPEETETVVSMTGGEALRLAGEAVMEKYRLSEKELNVYFSEQNLLSGNLIVGEENGALYLVNFHTHAWVDTEMMYGVLVNAATGKAEAAASYRPEDLTPEWRLLEFAAEKESRDGWYLRWSLEDRKKLAELIKACGLFPDHDYWRIADPEEAQTDAFIAAVFGAEGYPSAVNVTVMLHALCGRPDSWDPETFLLENWLISKYGISSADHLALLKSAGQEIDAETAVRLIREAVCEAWGMPAGALDDWVSVAQLTQGSDQAGGQVFYRVFLTRPDSELGQDTFGGKDNFNYRISVDGVILDSNTASGWYSPKEDMERWTK